MKSYRVTIYNKENIKLQSCVIKSGNDIGIILKGKMRMLDKIKFDKRKHEISFIEV